MGRTWEAHVAILNQTRNPPHPPGAERVKLVGRHPLDPKLESKQDPPYPPASPKLRPERPSSSQICFLPVSFGTFCSHRFGDAFVPGFFEILTISGSDLVSILVPFSFNSSYLFRTLFSHAYVLDLY